MNRRGRLGAAVFAAAALALLLGGAGSARAGFLINVQFNEQDKFTHSPAYSGAGVLGQAGDAWNGFGGSVLGGDPGASNQPLFNSDGTASTLTLSYTAPGGFFDTSSNGGIFEPTKYKNLLDAYLFTNSSETVSFNGLNPGEAYRLLLYSASNNPVRGAVFTVDGDSQEVTTPDTSLTPGDGYADFTVTADASGQLSILLTPGPTGRGNPEGDLNAIQLQTVPAPQPASLTLLATGVVGLCGYGRQKRRPPA
jgi:hypothetical protein